MDQLGYTMRAMAITIGLRVFGRDDDANPSKADGMIFTSDDFKDILSFSLELLEPKTFGMMFPLSTAFPVPSILDACVSDTNKPLLMEQENFVETVRVGLLLDPQQYRNRPDIVTGPTPLEVRQAVQRDSVECIEQLSLFPPTRQGLLAHPADIVGALRSLQAKGLTPEIRRRAKSGLLSLEGMEAAKATASGSGGGGGKDSAADKHIMISYSWANSEVIHRVWAALQSRSYQIWIGGWTMAYSCCYAHCICITTIAACLPPAAHPLSPGPFLN